MVMARLGILGFEVSEMPGSAEERLQGSGGQIRLLPL
jgi:hypothetical protein